MPDIELRSSNEPLKVEERAEGDSNMTIAGYAAVFDKLSSDLGGFKEMIAPGAFDDVLDNDVRAAFNHNADYILGRSSAGTLRLNVDDVGLRYEVDLPDTTVGRDLYESVKRGDIKESSFKFSVLLDDWSYSEEVGELRIIKKVGRLVDVAPVSFPAYPDATVAARSLQEWRKVNARPDMTELNKKRCDLLRIDLESKS